MRHLPAILLVAGALACTGGALGGALGGMGAWPLAGCSGLTCSGCCDDEDVCQAGTDDGACGEGGGRCMACPGNQICGQSIAAGSVECAECSSSNCEGCCDVAGACRLGTEDDACGLFQCEVCPSGYFCQGRLCAPR
ncbi:MAG: hypothetical protein HY904_22145 [Deltaproteobacteria bacterium]|nr:hypothetical protein [Deltaproteobacteria bacterium]